MCLAIPGRILNIEEPEGGLRQGEVSFGGIRRGVCLVCTPEAKVGDYVLVHVGFAISTVDEAEAVRLLDDLRRLGDLEREIGGAP
jgi:hydrogenase expression/formation protein HypC